MTRLLERSRGPTSWLLLCGLLPAARFVLAHGLHAQEQAASGPDRGTMYRHLKKAQDIAGLDLYPHFAHRCLVDQTYRRTISRSIQANGAIEPLKVFDNLYFVGQNAVSSWAITTSAGIVIVDSLNRADEVKTYIAAGLGKVGFDSANIKYVILTHAHGDHVNGAAYLQDTYGTRTMASRSTGRPSGASSGGWRSTTASDSPSVTPRSPFTSLPVTRQAPSR
jgi:metallo-beta-lactamase class B